MPDDGATPSRIHLYWRPGCGFCSMLQRKLDKLERMLARATNGGDKVAPLFPELLSVPTDDRYPALDLSPEQRKGRTLAALIARALAGEAVAVEVRAFRHRFTGLHFMHA